MKTSLLDEGSTRCTTSAAGRICSNFRSQYFRSRETTTVRGILYDREGTRSSRKTYLRHRFLPHSFVRFVLTQIKYQALNCRDKDVASTCPFIEDVPVLRWPFWVYRGVSIGSIQCGSIPLSNTKGVMRTWNVLTRPEQRFDFDSSIQQGKHLH